MILTPESPDWTALIGASVEADVVIIGSGAGGAAASLRLAEAGLDVVVLEEGGAYDERHFSQDQGVAWRQLYADDGQRVMSGNLYVPVAGGRCLGGSTVVNSAICFSLPDWRWAEWSAERALDDIAWEEMQSWVRRTERFIHVTASRPSIYGKNNAVCQRGLDALGWSGGPMMRNAPACMGCGACQMGCPSGATCPIILSFCHPCCSSMPRPSGSVPMLKPPPAGASAGAARLSCRRSSISARTPSTSSTTSFQRISIRRGRIRRAA